MQLFFRSNPKIKRDELQQLFVLQGLSMKTCALKLHVSTVAIWKAVKRFGFKLHIKHFDSECFVCGKTIRVHRKRFRSGGGKYCSQACYHAHRRIANNYAGQWREGQRIARLVVQAKPGQIVHHIDGNCHNNSPENILTFNSHAEHLHHHHSIRNSQVPTRQDVTRTE